MAKTKSPALGKGLDALLGPAIGSEGAATIPTVDQQGHVHGPETDIAFPELPSAPEGTPTLVDVASIDPNPYQPRRTFNDEELEGLADSIKQYGIIQPLTVRHKGERYELISGERRWRAAQKAGLTQVPVYLRDSTDSEVRVMALIENIQREDLNPIEIAECYKQIVDEVGLTHDELAQKIGKSRAQVTNQLRLLILPEELRDAVRRGGISLGHAKVLLGVDDPQVMLTVGRMVIEKTLSVREAEALIKKIREELALKRAAQQTEQALQEQHDEQEGMPDYLKELQARLGWGVSVQTTPKGSGKIVISYRTAGELEDLLHKLLSIEA